MILKGSQRGGGEQLATHLINERENDHVTLHELRGFMSEDLEGAFAEMHAMSKATQCKQFMFSLSLNPPKDAACDVDALAEAADRAESLLGLEGQQRAIVIHEKQGRRHAHVVWSRIDADTLKAVPMPFFKNKLATLSKELYLEHEWELPDGHKENGWKNPLNFTLAEWQQAKRIGLDPREIKQMFRESWSQSDNLQSFRNAMAEKGFFLAEGRRGFVALDANCETFSVSRQLGLKVKDVEAKLGSSAGLPGVDAVENSIRDGMSRGLKTELKAIRKMHRREVVPLLWERRKLVLTGRAAAVRGENEREAFAGHRRDVEQRERIVLAQFIERRDIQQRLDETRSRQRQELRRLAGRVASILRLSGDVGNVRQRPRHQSPSLAL
jgi:hypothetical protein